MDLNTPHALLAGNQMIKQAGVEQGFNQAENKIYFSSFQSFNLLFTASKFIFKMLRKLQSLEEENKLRSANAMAKP